MKKIRLDSQSHWLAFLPARLKELLEAAAIPIDGKKVKLEAWFVKGCCVLIKKKLGRGQWPKPKGFRLLMAAAMGSDDAHDDDARTDAGTDAGNDPGHDAGDDGESPPGEAAPAVSASHGSSVEDTMGVKEKRHNEIQFNHVHHSLCFGFPPTGNCWDCQPKKHDKSWEVVAFFVLLLLPCQDPAPESSYALEISDEEMAEEEVMMEDDPDQEIPTEFAMDTQPDANLPPSDVLPPSDSEPLETCENLEMGPNEVDKASHVEAAEECKSPAATAAALRSPSIPALGRGKSGILDLVGTYDETDEAIIAEDKKKPLFSPDELENVSHMEQQLRELRAKHAAIRGKRMANAANLQKLAADASKAGVIPVEDSLPFGRDTMDTMEMPEDAANLMDKFNQVAEGLELENTQAEPVPWHIFQNWLTIHERIAQETKSLDSTSCGMISAHPS